MQPEIRLSNTDFLVGLSPGGWRQNSESVNDLISSSGVEQAPELQSRNLLMDIDEYD